MVINSSLGVYESVRVQIKIFSRYSLGIARWAMEIGGVFKEIGWVFKERGWMFKECEGDAREHSKSIMRTRGDQRMMRGRLWCQYYSTTYPVHISWTSFQ